MERDPNHDRIVLEFSNATFELEPDKTSAYLHEGAHCVYDHIFLIGSVDPEDEEVGVAFFRESIQNFDEIIGLMRARDGFSFVEKPEVSDFDREMYQGYFNRLPDLGVNQPVVSVELETHPITPRQDRLIAFLGHLLHNDHLTMLDFAVEGDLFL